VQTNARRTAAAAALFALLAGLVWAPTPAAAAVTPVPYRCTTDVTQAFGVEHEAAEEDVDVRITSAATIENGSTLTLGWTIARLPSSPPVALTDVNLRTTARIELTLSGDTEVVDKSADDGPFDLDPTTALPGTRSFTFFERVIADNADDQLLVRPGTLTVEYLTGSDGIGGATVECVPLSDDPIRTVTVLGEPPACLEDDSCEGDQTFVGDPPDDALSLDVDPDGDVEANLVLPPVGTSPDEQSVSVDDVVFARVSDRRDMPVGWSLTARLDGPLQRSGAPALPASAVSVDQLACGQTAGASGSAPAVAGDDGGTLDEPVELCSVQPGALGNTGSPGGQWDVAGRVSLTLPPFAGAGTYSGVIVLTLT
jgi:hypothetical protein